MDSYKKCDLHVHSSSCYSRNYEKADFIEALVKSPLDVIAITDHNVVDKELIREVASRCSKIGKKIFAGVELNVRIKDEEIDTRKLFVPDDKKYFHAIVWCEANQAEALQEAVYRLLDSIGIDDRTRCGKSIQEISGLTAGKAFHLDEIRTQLGEIRHYFVFHENKSDRNLSDYLPNMGYEKSHIISESEVVKLKNNEKYKESLFYYNQALAVEGGKKNREIADCLSAALNTTVSSFFCSDALKLSDIGSKFTWIDFDGDLDSLNLAFTDPESRISTSDLTESIPQENTNNYLESIKISLLDAGSYREQVLDFSPGYNGIIGARGSGKSLLAHILKGSGISVYDKLIDSASILYKTASGEFTKNPPPSLYLEQGELKDIFDNQRYNEVSFLKGKLNLLQKKATESAKFSYDQISTAIAEQKEAVKSFLRNYGGRPVSLDVLSAPEPEGNMLEIPSQIPASDKDCLNSASEILEKVSQNLESAKNELKKVSLKTDYLESNTLFVSLSQSVVKTNTAIEDATSSVKKMIQAIDLLDSEPFETRRYLLDHFIKQIDKWNLEGSSELSQYKKEFKNAKTFLDDLLKLRITFDESNQAIAANCGNMLSPIEPEEHKVSEADTITIALKYEESVSYKGAINAQFKGDCKNDPEIILACFALKASEIEQASKVFNGTKYRNLKDGVNYIDKYYSNILSELGKNKNIHIGLSHNGQSLDGMSPGAQAQILLKLFLHESLLGESYQYIILDQPEDNLDTQTIKEFLVDEIKGMKKKVQLFIVSHSATVIVNGDARKVVVAEAGHDGTVSYRSDVINGKETKQSIAEILDGGERYLKMRLYKYDFQSEDKR